jgi:hypothetical protein
MKNNYFLVLSSSLFFVSIIYFIKNFDNNNFEILFALLLLLNIIISILFWKDASYKSIIHKLDGLLGKISFILGCCYVLLIKDDCSKYHKIIFIILVMVVLLLFYKSDKISKKSWCSRNHILTHSIFHIFSTACTLFVFI